MRIPRTVTSRTCAPCVSGSGEEPGCYHTLRVVIQNLGIPLHNVSMALGWAAEEGIFNPGDKVIFCIVGAGLTFAVGLLVW